MSIDALSTDKSSPQTVNTTIRITANASGGSSLLYKFIINDGSGSREMHDYSSSNYCDWTPSAAGKYVISVYVKDENSNNEPDALKEMNFVIEAPVDQPLVFSSITTDKPSPQPANTSIRITANASITTDKVSPQPAKSTIRVSANVSGGSNLIYRFIFFNRSNLRTEVKDYSSSNYCDWTPTKAGKYTISVYVKDKKSVSPGILKSISYTISKVI